MLQWKTEGTQLYQQLPREMYLHAKPCEPLNEIPTDRPIQKVSYKPWNKKS